MKKIIVLLFFTFSFDFFLEDAFAMGNIPFSTTASCSCQTNCPDGTSVECSATNTLGQQPTCLKAAGYSCLCEDNEPSNHLSFVHCTKLKKKGATSCVDQSCS